MECELFFHVRNFAEDDIMSMLDLCILRNVSVETFGNIIVKYMKRKFCEFEYFEYYKSRDTSALRLWTHVGYPCIKNTNNKVTLWEMEISKLFNIGSLEIHMRNILDMSSYRIYTLNNAKLNSAMSNFKPPINIFK